MNKRNLLKLLKLASALEENSDGRFIVMGKQRALFHISGCPGGPTCGCSKKNGICTGGAARMLGLVKSGETMESTFFDSFFDYNGIGNPKLNVPGDNPTPKQVAKRIRKLVEA